MPERRPSLEALPGLLSLLAHDLRNPLSALQSNVGFLGSVLDKSDPDVVDALGDAELSCAELIQLIDSLELLGRAMGTESLPGRRPADLMVTAQRAVESVRRIAASYEVPIQLDAGAMETGVTVLTNQSALTRALVALLRNAVQHAPPGSSVRLMVNATVSEGELIVCDSGSVLEPALRDVAFSADGQLALKGSTSGRYSRGLGLFCAGAYAVAAGALLSGAEVAGANAFRLAIPRGESR